MPESYSTEVLCTQAELNLHLSETQEEQVHKDIIARMIFDASSAPKHRLAADGEGSPESSRVQEPFVQINAGSSKQRNASDENRGARRSVELGCNKRQGPKIYSDQIIYGPVPGWEKTGCGKDPMNCFIPWIDLLLPASSQHGSNREQRNEAKPLREWNF
ncbi:hypothetical protein GUITHDRAFT_106583 [Guillardia theta CCMP2712]|uniref:Uncharacterized protein n=1 Tax=Guillardia theta (strain CCMP2712) TaxID=905079 RepID=L1JGH1_GUITC|nr:hypothetical protein GUITHDRAFT_106583 [Guillardia theta CCMP2712]EKX47596.1 hypothetical protein GUITHDRAFT_106583 [Guillardia theta CCMP2712]|eukprot:XP_005834576.1 hypothetical protein GUITHDRAFT_106583 [Guillardia theta CCMP2712]